MKNLKKSKNQTIVCCSVGSFGSVKNKIEQNIISFSSEICNKKRNNDITFCSTKVLERLRSWSKTKSLKYWLHSNKPSVLCFIHSLFTYSINHIYIARSYVLVLFHQNFDLWIKICFVTTTNHSNPQKQDIQITSLIKITQWSRWNYF